MIPRRETVKPLTFILHGVFVLITLAIVPVVLVLEMRRRLRKRS